MNITDLTLYMLYLNGLLISYLNAFQNCKTASSLRTVYGFIK